MSGARELATMARAVIVRMAILGGVALALAGLVTLGGASDPAPAPSPRAAEPTPGSGRSAIPLQPLARPVPSPASAQDGRPPPQRGRVPVVEPRGSTVVDGWSVQAHGWQDAWSLSLGNARSRRERCILVRLTILNVSGGPLQAFPVSLWNWLLWDAQGISYGAHPCGPDQLSLSHYLDPRSSDWEQTWPAGKRVAGTLSFPVPFRAAGFVLQWGSALLASEERWRLVYVSPQDAPCSTELEREESCDPPALHGGE